MNLIGGKNVICLLLALLICAVFSACVIETDEKPEPPAKSRGSFMEDDPVKQAASRTPLTIVTRNFTKAGSVVNCPYIASRDMDLLNYSIRSAFADFAETCAAEDGYVSYSVEFNSMGLLSLTMIMTGPNGLVYFTDTANFNCDSGSRVLLDDCFGEAYTDYTSRLRGIVETYAEQNGLELIGGVPPIRDVSPFIFTENGISLVYREYELTTYSDTPVRVPIPLAAVKDLVAVNGVLNRYSP